LVDDRLAKGVVFKSVAGLLKMLTFFQEQFLCQLVFLFGKTTFFGGLTLLVVKLPIFLRKQTTNRAERSYGHKKRPTHGKKSPTHRKKRPTHGGKGWAIGGGGCVGQFEGCVGFWHRWPAALKGDAHPRSSDGHSFITDPHSSVTTLTSFCTTLTSFGTNGRSFSRMVVIFGRIGTFFLAKCRRLVWG